MVCPGATWVRPSSLVTRSTGPPAWIGSLSYLQVCEQESPATHARMTSSPVAAAPTRPRTRYVALPPAGKVAEKGCSTKFVQLAPVHQETASSGGVNVLLTVVPGRAPKTSIW